MGSVLRPPRLWCSPRPRPAVAACIGIGIAAFEDDLRGREFGWRQLVSAGSLVLVAVGLLPVLGGAVGGRRHLPAQGVEQPLAFLAQPSTGVARVLWLGDPGPCRQEDGRCNRGWPTRSTPQQLPDATQVFTPAGPGPAGEVAKAVRLAVAGGTVHLGRLLAPAGVRYVVVVDALAPSLVGSSPASVSAPPPADLNGTSSSSRTCRWCPGSSARRSTRTGRTCPSPRRVATTLPVHVPAYPSATDVGGWQPVLSALSSGGPATGAVPAGTLYAGYAQRGASP